MLAGVFVYLNGQQFVSCFFGIFFEGGTSIVMSAARTTSLLRSGNGASKMWIPSQDMGMNSCACLFLLLGGICASVFLMLEQYCNEFVANR